MLLNMWAVMVFVLGTAAFFCCFCSPEGGCSLKMQLVPPYWALGIYFFYGAYLIFKRDARALNFMSWLILILLIPGCLLLIVFLATLANNLSNASSFWILVIASILLFLGISLAVYSKSPEVKQQFEKNQ